MSNWIVCLGVLATQALVHPGARITRVRGQWFVKEGMKIQRSTRRGSRATGRRRPAAEDFRKLAAARRAFEEARLRERKPARAEQLSLDFSGPGRGLA